MAVRPLLEMAALTLFYNPKMQPADFDFSFLNSPVIYMQYKLRKFLRKRTEWIRRGKDGNTLHWMTYRIHLERQSFKI